MKLTKLFSVLACAVLSSATVPTKTVKRVSPQFVQTQGSKFTVNGSEFPFIGTNVYWLAALNTEQDIIDTFSNISRLGINVVRTWAFNDVETIPENGTWFQLISNGTTTINNGTNGLQKLDLIIQHAERFGIYVLLSLTNNWSPLATDNLTDSIANLQSSVQSRATPVEVFNTSRARNFLSNDYGGMDVYVRQFGLKNHDEFYTNETLVQTYMNYTTQIVTRYVNSPSVFAWEIANDPRCNSSVAASPGCTANNITQWHSRIATHISSIDPNHLIASGSQGFLCLGCPKLFPLNPPAPPPGPSAPATPDRRTIAKPLTRARIIQERNERWKKTRALLPKSEQEQGARVRIRGRWVSTPTKRQDGVQGVGSAFDGSQGVDSEDILNIPQIGFGSFQLFPDQNSYGVDDPSLPAFNNTLQSGLDWITTHGQVANIYNKPVTLTGFGLVTQDNAPFFVPFNTTIAPFASQSTTNTTQNFGVTDSQQATAYSSWLNAGITSGISGLIQYQWSQGNLTGEPGTAISSNSDVTGQSSNSDTTSESPNDGYSIQGVGQSTIQGILQNAVQSVGNA
ncbi:glycoside hydrolase family 5 protein [Collybiopsis luxurians FD-317 M1]|uniref:mannan endo-1,4-beta-mannosidase n=1 Tax=Collybiopsis luxurians FD-317 M1 TaxID=944289 RepID=A0A0D0B3K0_9AGAR|nr:glycoside hydrolase family 5 protein [Collybiopsis luxurians FD-317 M1]